MSDAVEQINLDRLRKFLESTFDLEINYQGKHKVKLLARLNNPLTEGEALDRADRQRKLRDDREKLLVRPATEEESKALGVSQVRRSNDEIDWAALRNIDRALELIEGEIVCDHFGSFFFVDEPGTVYKMTPEFIVSELGRNWPLINHWIEWKGKVQYPNPPTAKS